MLKKTRALVAAGAGAAILLTSGATFALWQAEDRLEITDPIRTGTLAIEGASFEWHDHSKLILEDGVFVDNTEFPKFSGKIVPGDVIVGRIDANELVDWVGTNLAWELYVNDGVTGTFDVATEQASEINGLDVTAQLFDSGDDKGVIEIRIDWTKGITNGFDPVNDALVVDTDNIRLVVRQVRQ